MAIDVSKGITHLEHLEDFLLVGGKEGGEKALDTVRKFVASVREDSEDIVVSEKIDGAPSLYFGKDPDGRFFVSTKSLFNKVEQKIGYSLADIQRLWSGGIVPILSMAFKNLKPAFKSRNMVGQGDILFVSKNSKSVTEHEGQKYITFQPNTIMYAVPADPKSDLYKNVKQANLGIVVHGAYESTYDTNNRLDLNRLADKAVTEIAQELDKDSKVFAVDPYVKDISPLKGSEDELTEISELVSSVESAIDDIDPEFDEAWSNATDPMIKKARSLLPIFINQQVRGSGESETILSAKDEKHFLKLFKRKLNEFIDARSQSAQAKLKTSAGKEKKGSQFDEFKTWVKDMDDTFAPMLRAYFRLFSIKNLIVRLFDGVEKKLGSTFVVDRQNDYEIHAVKPEGYVLLNGPNMVKIVDRAEFSRNNMLYSPFHEESNVSGGTTGDPESIGDKKPLKIKSKKSLTDEVVEEVLDSIKSVEKMYDGFNDEKIVETADKFKKYDAVYVGRFQPPTIAHVNNLVNLSKLFKNVYVLLSESSNKTEKYLEKNPLDSEDRKELFLSDPKIRSLKNVKFSGGGTPLIFGINTPDKEKELRRLFDIPESNVLVITLGKEEDRYFKLKKTGTFFDLNMDGTPDEDKPFGLYGIDLEKIPGAPGKVSATQIRKEVAEGNIDEAKEIMAGDSQTQDKIIEILKNHNQERQKREDFLASEEEYFKIEEFDVRKELVHEIEEDYGIGQEEAMELLFEILERRGNG